MRPQTLSLLLLPLLTTAAPTTPPPAKVSTVYQYPKGTWIENLAATRNGSLLISLLGAQPANLDILDPSSKNAPHTVHSFPDINSLFGITELEPNVFAVAGGNYSSATGPSAGTFGVWRVDLRQPCHPAKVSKIAGVGKYMLNGLASASPDLILGADTFAGVIIGIDVRTGAHYVALDDESLKPTGSGPFKGGANGLKVHAGYAYYTNSLHQTLSKVKIDAKTGKAVGPFTLVSDQVPVPDDVAVARDGTAYVANVFGNTITRVDRNGGEARAVAGGLNSSAIAGPTSVTIGRGKKDRGVVYVGTSGGVAGPVNGTYTEGGKVVAVYL